MHSPLQGLQPGQHVLRVRVRAPARQNCDEDDVVEVHHQQRVCKAPPHRPGEDMGEHDQRHVVMPGVPYADLELVHPEAGIRVPEARSTKWRRDASLTVRSMSAYVGALETRHLTAPVPISLRTDSHLSRITPSPRSVQLPLATVPTLMTPAVPQRMAILRQPETGTSAAGACAVMRLTSRPAPSRPATAQANHSPPLS